MSKGGQIVTRGDELSCNARVRIQRVLDGRKKSSTQRSSSPVTLLPIYPHPQSHPGSLSFGRLSALSLRPLDQQSPMPQLLCCSDPQLTKPYAPKHQIPRSGTHQTRHHQMQSPTPQNINPEIVDSPNKAPLNAKPYTPKHQTLRSWTHQTRRHQTQRPSARWSAKWCRAWLTPQAGVVTAPWQ